MSTIIYQGVQSCLESQVIETTTLKLKVAYNHQDYINNTKESTQIGGFAFLGNLPNISSTPLKETSQKQSSYVHPLTKSSLKLSQKSLELCTENLGCETGTESMVTTLFSPRRGVSTTGESQAEKFTDMSISPSLSTGQCPVEKNKVTTRSKGNPRDFPPPLTTMRSSNHLQVRPHREDGRLIIKAIEIPTRDACFQAERSDGRLRLCLWKDTSAHHIEDEEAIEEYDESDIDDEDGNQEEGDDDVSKDMEGNNMDGEVEIGIEKIQTLSRCMEGGRLGNNKELCNWKPPLCIATS